MSVGGVYWITTGQDAGANFMARAKIGLRTGTAALMSMRHFVHPAHPRAVDNIL
jgi:hypothetical protein